LKTTRYNEFSALAQLKRRITANYENFKSEMLTLSEEDIYDNAHRIAIVQDAYEELTGDGMDYMNADEIKILLNYYDPLVILADYVLKGLHDEYPINIDEAIIELINDTNAREKYLSVDYAEFLMDKHGTHIPVQSSLLKETIEAGERYVRLLKLTHNIGTDKLGEIPSPFDITGFDEDCFFICEDDEEVYF